VEICKFGDELIEQKTSGIYKGKSKTGKVILKGIAFPVCLSVNEVVCHCSPLESDETVSYCFC
jgi:methionine aminopeptidase